jgi:uncharacterized protein (DUF2267 family)
VAREVVAMDQLVKLVSERAGIPPEQARVAVETVLGFLKERLPAPIASQIDGVIGNTGGSSGGLGGLLGR